MKVLAVGCHPDDLEIACGGTLHKYTQNGAEVVMCHVVNGNLGHAVIPPQELRDLRRIEAQNAGKVLGVKEVISLDVDDIQVNHYDNTAVDAMAEVVRYVRPDVIITHNNKDYMQDHVETSMLVFNSSFVSSLVHKSMEKLDNSAVYPIFVPIYYMDTLAGVDFIPTHYVDITAHIDVKLEALSCHETQIKWMLEHDNIDFSLMVKTCSQMRGYQCGVDYAEGFRPCTVYPRMTAKHLLP